MHLPKRIRIGWRWYKVIKWKREDGEAAACFGQCNSTLGMIWVSTRYGQAKAAHTFLHEVLHGIWAERGLSNEVEEEMAVSELSRGLCALARDNPDIVQDWLNVMRSDA